LARESPARPRISLVTPSFNQGEFIARTVESVLSQRGDFELDYRILDGGSNDDTLAILERYRDRLTFVSERDGGQVDAINKGLRATTGDIVGWVNSDDVLLPGALAAVADAFRAHPECEWLHGRCEIIDQADRPVRKWVSLYKHVRATRHSFDNLITENYVSQMTAFWRRSVHEAIGYLDPALHYAFDYDLWLRLARRGDPLYLPQKLACFRWYPTSKSGAMFERQFREDLAVAQRYAADKPLVLLRKRAKTEAIMAIYRALALGRLGSSGGPTR
jgi:glycosyltransferase involved in cell wall biosynthesis